MPTIEDVRKASEQARSTVVGAFDQARTPLLAVLGAGDLAAQAVIDALTKARTQINERAEAARSAVGDLPSDVTSLGRKLDPSELNKLPSELNKLVEQYGETVQKLYHDLAEQGEKALDKLRSQPQYKKAVEQFDQAVETAQHRAEAAVEDARELADEVLGKVVRRTRSTGEKAARATEKAAEDLSGKIVEAGEEAAHEVRSTTRKAANRTNTVRKQATGTTKPSTSKTTED